VVTAIECLFSSLHVQLRNAYAQIFISQYPLFAMIDLASDEEYCVPYILAITKRVQYFAQVVVELQAEKE